MDTLWTAELNVIRALQSLGAWLTPLMRLLSFLGEEQFYLAALPILYWIIDARIGARVAVYLVTSVALNDALKLLWHTPRPYWISRDVEALAVESTFGLPSGHGQNGVAVWGSLAGSVARRGAWLAVILLILGIGLSRVYLGVHFPSDVFGGWAVGGLLLWAGRRYEKRIVAGYLSWTAAQQVGLALAAALTLVALGAASLALLGTWSVPPAWDANALAATGAPLEAPNIRNVVSSAGVLFGLMVAGARLQRRGGFSARGSATQRAARLALGLVVVLMLWQGLAVVLPRDDSVLAYGLRFARYALVGAWVAGLAPALFIRLGWATRSPS